MAWVEQRRGPMGGDRFGPQTGQGLQGAKPTAHLGMVRLERP
jgi:hypothetical protein